MSDRSDNFDRTDSTTSLGTPSDAGGAWTAHSGTWGIVSNQGYKVSSNTVAQYASLECSSADGDVQVTLATSSNAGVVGRFSSTSNFILGQVETSPGRMRCWKWVSGTPTQLGSTYTGTQSNGDVYLMSIDGSDNIVFSQNGTSRVTATDSAHNTNTRWGLFCNLTTARFEDWSFTDDNAGGGTANAWYYRANTLIQAA